VLLHEIAHAARFDPLTQFAAQLACCLYWFNPLAWVASRNMAMERERACDDRVLASGAGATDYAGHLVEIARELRGRKPWLSAAIAMANRSQLEPRLLAILDRHLRRRGVTPKRIAIVAGLATLLVLPLAAMRPRAGNPGAVSGVIYDGIGVVPGAEVTLVRRANGDARRMSSDPTGVYRFDALEPGGYELVIRAPGFAEHRIGNVQVAGGQEARRASYLRIGNVEERLDVVAERPAVRLAAPTRRPSPQRVRVGGNVQPAKLLKMVPPRYPDEAREAGAEGFVSLRAIVRRDGTVGALTVLDAPHPALAEAARQAVSLWNYQPVTLNGEPVEVETLINVRFRLTQ
jgi:TonB family protein